MLTERMFTFTHILTGLQGAIAVVSARERALTVLLVAVWGRIGRIRTRLERLVALWRAGKLPQARAAHAKRQGRPTGEKPISMFPTAPAWLVTAVPKAQPLAAQLEAMLSQEECVRFLAEVPQARRLLGGLCRMLGIAAHRARAPRPLWQVPRAAVVMAAPAGLVMGPGGRLMYV